jgi:putative toxin-antitoxin system antitoxin component (TIGR02293 family)
VGLDKVEQKCHFVHYWWQTAQTMRKKSVQVSGFADGPATFHVGDNRVGTEALHTLSRHGYSEDEIFALVVPKRTLARRKAANEPLTVEETDKALRLDRIAEQAERVFGGAEKSQRWLRKPKRELKGETPLAYLASEAGARVVEEMLFRIEHGIFA